MRLIAMVLVAPLSSPFLHSLCGEGVFDSATERMKMAAIPTHDTEDPTVAGLARLLLDVRNDIRRLADYCETVDSKYESVGTEYEAIRGVLEKLVGCIGSIDQRLSKLES